MRFPLGERAVATILVVPTAVAVIMLAIVQYRWSEQVRSATSIRLADSLQMAMVSWHLNLFRELADVCLRMRLDSESVAGGELAEAARRFQEQQAAAEYPGIVSELAVVSLEPRLPSLRWNPIIDGFEPRPEASHLEALRQQLPRISAAATAPGAIVPPRSGEPNGFPSAIGCSSNWRFEPDLPGLLRPISTNVSAFNGMPLARGTTAAWLVIRLNADVISRRVLPELANRYFSGIDGLDYEVALVAGGRPRRVIYSSDPSFAVEDPRDADGRMNLFGRALDDTAASGVYVFHTPSRSTGPPMAVRMTWFPLLRQTPSRDD